MPTLNSVLTWLQMDNHAASISALGSLASATFAFVAFMVAFSGLIVAAWNFRVAHRKARSDIEPWLELAPKTVVYEAKWDVDETEIQVQLPGSTEFVGTRPEFKGPTWPLGNIGGGPAIDVEAIWRFDDTLITKSIVRAGQTVGKDLAVQGLNIVDKGLRRLPLAHFATRVLRPLGFLLTAKDETEFMNIEIPSWILNCATVHVMSVADRFGEYAVGEIDLLIQYRNKFAEPRNKQFHLEYDGCPLWDKDISVDGKDTLLKCEIKLNLKRKRIQESLLRRAKYEHRARRGVGRYLRAEKKRATQEIAAEFGAVDPDDSTLQKRDRTEANPSPE